MRMQTGEFEPRAGQRPADGFRRFSVLNVQPKFTIGMGSRDVRVSVDVQARRDAQPNACGALLRGSQRFQKGQFVQAVHHDGLDIPFQRSP